MKHFFLFIGIVFIFLGSCKIKTAEEQKAVNELVLTEHQSTSSATTDTNRVTLDSDSLLNLQIEDTVDCGAVVNTIFRRSFYKFPVEGFYKKEDLTAVIESAKDSILLIKVMLVDSITDHRETVDWMRLNCKNKRLEEVPLYGSNPQPILVKYDVRFLEILMRNCSLNY